MSDVKTIAETSMAAPVVRLVAQIVALLDGIPSWLYALMMRVSIFLVFFLSARTKVEGLITLKQSTFLLFEHEYALPIIPYKLAAYLATYSEHAFSILVLVGLATRFSALALLGMTAVIEIFVYPEAYVVHLTWAAMLTYLVACGGGALSIDRLIAKNYGVVGK